MRVISNYSKPLVLSDGTILAASGTDGSVRTVKTLSDRDQRYADRGWISVMDEPLGIVEGGNERPSKKKEAN